MKKFGFTFLLLLSCHIFAESQVKADLSFGQPVGEVLFSPDGKLLAVRSDILGQQDTVLRVWDANLLQVRYDIKTNRTFVQDMAFSPSSKLLALAVGDLGVTEVFVYDAGTGSELGRYIEKTKLNPRVDNTISSIAFSPDGKRLAIGQASGDMVDVVRLLDIEKLSNITIFQPEVYRSSGRAGALAFSPTGPYLAFTTSSGAPQDDGRVVVIDLSRSQPVLNVKMFGTGHLLAFSADGNILAVSGLTYDRRSDTRKNELALFDSSTWKQTTKLVDYPAGLEGLGFADNGKVLATAGHTNRPSFEVSLLDIKRFQTLREFKDLSPIFTTMAVSPNGHLLALGSANGKVEILCLGN